MKIQSPHQNPSRRSPVIARIMVAASQPLAFQARLKMLSQGGNAIDAAVATAITLTLVEPTGCGLGSDAFAIIWDGKKLHGLNSSGRSPASWSYERFRKNGGIPFRGWDSVTVPGAVGGWVELSSKFGRLPFENLFEIAIKYANDGFPVSPVIAKLWAKGSVELKDGVEMVMPGDNIEIVAELISPIAMDKGLKFAIREGGKTVGAGVVSEILG